jgi:predicted HicB family RNase H-like nuclease
MAKNINIEIPETLHKNLKIKALEKDMTLKDFIISILEK